MIGAGGTGGHVYPALATAEAILQRSSETNEIHFVGSVGGFERNLIIQSNLPFASVNEVYAGPIHGVGILRAIISIFKLLIGTIQSFFLLIRYRPASIFLTGGWTNIPVAVAGWVMRTPIVIYLPDIEPGLTIQVLRRFASKVAITVADSEKYFKPGQTVVTGYVLSQDRINASREEGLQHFQLDPDRVTLLVSGGSRGAQSINIALVNILPQLLEQPNLQILHVTGEFDWERVQTQLEPLGDPDHYQAFPYLHDDMGLALAVADIMVSRAGASVLGEVPLFATAAILVPYPYAWRYQKVNADYLASRGAAIRLDDEDMEEKLLPSILELLNNTDRMQSMQDHAKQLAVRDGAERVAELLIEIGGGTP